MALHRARATSGITQRRGRRSRVRRSGATLHFLRVAEFWGKTDGEVRMRSRVAAGALVALGVVVARPALALDTECPVAQIGQPCASGTCIEASCCDNPSGCPGEGGATRRACALCTYVGSMPYCPNADVGLPCGDAGTCTFFGGGYVPGTPTLDGGTTTVTFSYSACSEPSPPGDGGPASSSGGAGSSSGVGTGSSAGGGSTSSSSGGSGSSSGSGSSAGGRIGSRRPSRGARTQRNASLRRFWPLVPLTAESPTILAHAPAPAPRAPAPRGCRGEAGSSSAGAPGAAPGSPRRASLRCSGAFRHARAACAPARRSGPGRCAPRTANARWWTARSVPARPSPGARTRAPPARRARPTPADWPTAAR
jgi:hypothetical protein